jgi:hypothetical protein
MTKKPNILFFFPDQWNPDWLGCNPELPLKTPNIDLLMQNGVSIFTVSFMRSCKGLPGIRKGLQKLRGIEQYAGLRSFNSNLLSGI